jgi:alkanesulfonate monooxygenase SsuD/methylene tetrahydromethanopterin reductase-like flavin-dependent oxidoreductase (luciferase family)
MHVGLVMECDYRQGRTQEEAFQEAFTIADMAEDCGIDGVWFAERHFATHRRSNDPMGAGIPSVASVPLVWAAAIAARTKKLRVGTGVSVLPLCHPIRLAEEAATVDQISQGRLEFGVGRSGFPRSYVGYGIPYGESRDRFSESLEIIQKAWNEDRLTYQGKYYSFNDLAVMPRPYQKPHPPIRVAATTKDTFPLVGKLGLPLVSGLRGFTIPEVAQNLKGYREALHQAGPGDVYLRIPIYVAETDQQGIEEPRESTMRSYRRLGENFGLSASAPGADISEERKERYERLSNITYEELLEDRLAYGNPDTVARKLQYIIDELGLSGVIMEPNVGGQLSEEQVLTSIRLYGQEVAPKLRG